MISDNMRILIVDDSPTDRTFLRRILKQMGQHTVQDVGTRKDALDILTTTPFDLVFLDYYMPDVEGFSFLKEIRKLYPQLSIILFTSTIEGGIARQSVAAGADAYLAKILLAPTSVKRAIRRAQEATANRKQINWYLEEIAAFHNALQKIPPNYLEE